MFLAPNIVPKTLEQLEKVETNDAELRRQEALYQEQVGGAPHSQRCPEQTSMMPWEMHFIF